MFAALLLLIQFLNPPSVHKPTGYTHAVKTDGCKLLFLSGQVAYDKDGKLVGKDRRAQLREVRNKFVAKDRPPASTLVGVQALALPEFLVEVEAVACAK